MRPQPELRGELLARHKKERKELLQETLSIKKSAPVKDKKRRKEALARIAELESELKQRQEAELDEFDRTPGEVTGHWDNAQPEAEQTNAKQDSKSFKERESGIDDVIVGKSAIYHVREIRLSKRELKRRGKLAEEERIRQQALAEAAQQPDMQAIERNDILKQLSQMSCRMQEVRPDGHCLFSAIGEQVGMPFAEIRALAGAFIRKRKEEFSPFMVDDETGEMLTDGQIEDHCRAIESSSKWGGELEANAISSALRRPIQIIRMGAPPYMIGEEWGSSAGLLRLSYHKHMYGLGAHYNAVYVLDA